MKAILVLDKMPEDCNRCLLAGYIEEIDLYYCSAVDESCHRLKQYVNDLPRGFKPEWCPLRLLPERKEEMEYLATGWNACLDAIEEGEE